MKTLTTQQVKDKLNYVIRVFGSDLGSAAITGAVNWDGYHSAVDKCSAVKKSYDVMAARITELEAERDAARAEAQARLESHNAEVDKFSAGFNAYHAGLSLYDRPEAVYGVWRVGYAWAAYDAQVERIAELEAALDAAIKDRDWHSEQLDRRSERIAELEAERDGARAEAQARLEGREKRCCTW
jgi:outer membrane murein-binding lipoprotein Lpp